MNLKQQRYNPSQSERNQRLIPRLRYLAGVVNVRLAQAERAKKVSAKEETDDKTQSPLSQ